jgi:uncharacterized membrane protein YtjA (UPF0391 family)
MRFVSWVTDRRVECSYYWVNRAHRLVILVRKGEGTMLWTIILILLIMWALGFGFAGASVGGLIHILLVVALIVLVIQLVTGRRPVV